MSAAAMMPQIKSPPAPKLVPVNGNKNGEHKPRIEQSIIIDINALLVLRRWSVTGRAASPCAMSCSRLSCFCFLIK